jgi:4-amino-4-deoxy-L-arabinose transferase-like glycosyltransferase
MNPPTTVDASTPSLPPRHHPLVVARFRERREWIACLVLSALWFGLTLALRPLALPDEGRYVGVAWSMLQSGDWSVPRLDGGPFFHKPPLFYWITAAAMHVFGPGPAAARSASWLAGVAVTTGLFAFVRRWVGVEAARAAALVLATLPLFYAGAQYANLDMLVAGCIAGAVLLVAHAVLAQELGEPCRRVLGIAFGVAAVGVLAKGLIGVVLPVLVLLTWGLGSGRLSQVVKALTWLPGGAIFLAVAGPWFVAMQWRFPTFAHYFFVVQHFDRYVGGGFNNVEPFWFYPLALSVLALPWSPWLLVAALRQGRAALPSVLARDRGVPGLMIGWLGVVTLFFSFPSSKPVGYILPAAVPLAYLIAMAARAMAHGRSGLRRHALPLTGALAATCCVGAAIAAHYYQPKSQRTLALQLRAAMQPGEPVVFVGNYYYDVPFYARLTAPVHVVDPWRPAEVAQDSWRRELVDAQGFRGAPATPLLRPEELAPWLCGSHSAWLVGPWPTTPLAAWLADEPVAFRSGTTALWHYVATDRRWRRGLGCRATGAPDTDVMPMP